MQAPVSAISDLDHRVLLCQAFFAAVAHDLTNPLTSLGLWTDILQSLETRLSACGDAEAIALYRTAVEQITMQVGRSVSVVDDVLDISRLQAGQRLLLRAEPVDLVGLARSAIRARPEASKQERVLNLDASEPELWGCWDGERLGRVLENLLNNAIKYSPPETPITVRVGRAVRQGQPWAVLDVEDRGIGIPHDDLPHIFEPFRRGSNVNPSIRGNGLGLWFSRSIIARHGGTLSVASHTEKGTVVTLLLPLSPTGAVRSLDV